MEFIPPLLGFAFLAAALALLYRARRLARIAQRDLVVARAQVKAARQRSLGLVAEDLRHAGLALLGEAALPHQLAARAEAKGQHLLRLADEVNDLVAADTESRSLKEQPVALKPLVEETIAGIAASLAPGRRNWRLSPELDGILLQADPRALRGALSHVLIRTARLTGDQDWIDLRPVVTKDRFSLVVEDEGAGLHVPDLEPDLDLASAEADSPRTRGLSLGLATARALLHAHGGELLLEATPGVGSRAWLTLPRGRMGEH